MASSPAYLGASQAVAFGDSIERAWEGMRASALEADGNDAESPSTLRSRNAGLWAMLDASFKRFRARGAVDADMVAEHLKGVKHGAFDAHAARLHLRSAKDIASRMLARFPFPVFADSLHWPRLIANLRAVGAGVVVPADSMAFAEGAAAAACSGDALAKRLEGVRTAAVAVRSSPRGSVSAGAASAAAAARRAAWLADWSAAAETLPCMVTIADMQEPGVPIVYANAAFYRATGFDASEVIGRNCRFLQGAETSPETIELLRCSIRDGKHVQCEIVNYRKDGSRFNNFLTMKPVWENRVAPSGAVGAPPTKRMAFFIGVQFEVEALDGRGAVPPSGAAPPTKLLELEALLATLPNDVDQ